MSFLIDWLLFPNKNKKKSKKSKLKKGKFRDEEEVEVIKFVDEPVPVAQPEKLQAPVVEDRIVVPKGRALITVDKKSWFHIVMGLLLVIVNLVLLGIGLVGWVSRWEEKVLVAAYAIPSVYVTVKFTWLMIQGERVESTIVD